MKILTISDTHNKHNQIPTKYIDNINGEIDMIIHAGDMTMDGDDLEVEAFLEWYDKLNFKYKILIAGNHDFFFEDYKKEYVDNILNKYPSIIYLNDNGVEIEGFKIWGSPVQPWFYDWAFNKKGVEICKHWDMIPPDTNILITHGPIQGYLDITQRGNSTGCPYLREKVSKLKELKLFVCGHIHEGYGKTETLNGQIVINASVLDYKDRMANLPIIVEI
jgi:Icc-related predicted phosphoesterase